MPSSTRASGFADLAPIAGPPPSLRRRRLLRGTVIRRLSGKLGVALVVLVLTVAVFGPSLAPYDPFAITGESLDAPSFSHWMGTDALGRDVSSAVLFGARTSLLVSGSVC